MEESYEEMKKYLEQVQPELQKGKAKKLIVLHNVIAPQCVPAIAFRNIEYIFL